MALYTVQSVVGTGTTPAVITPTASDTISGNDIIPGGGCVIRVITAGTITNVSVLDPNLTASGNAGTVVAVACPATGIRMIFIPISAVNPATNLATITFSSVAACTVEAYKY
jgi:hypothetical protein